MLTRVAIAVAAVLVLAACGDSDAGAPAGSDDAPSTLAVTTSALVSSSTTAPPATTSPTTTVGISTSSASPTTATTAPPLAPRPCEAGDVRVQLTGGRGFRVVQPETDVVLPVVMVLHGFTGSPDAIEQTSGWSEVSSDVVLVYPSGLPVPDLGGFGWAAGTDRFSMTGVDDVAYLWAVYEAVVREHCGDPTRVLLTGESNGGAMAVRAACAAPFRGAVAMVAAVIPAVDEGAIAGCADVATALLVIASQNDRVVPFAPEARDDGDPMGQIEWFSEVATTGNRCSSVEAIEGGPVHNLWVGLGCAAPTALVGVIDGDGHTWPGGPVGTAGLDPGSFDATGAIAALFEGLTAGEPSLDAAWSTSVD